MKLINTDSHTWPGLTSSSSSSSCFMPMVATEMQHHKLPNPSDYVNAEQLLGWSVEGLAKWGDHWTTSDSLWALSLSPFTSSIKQSLSWAVGMRYPASEIGHINLIRNVQLHLNLNFVNKQIYLFIYMYSGAPIILHAPRFSSLHLPSPVYWLPNMWKEFLCSLPPSFPCYSPIANSLLHLVVLRLEISRQHYHTMSWEDHLSL